VLNRVSVKPGLLQSDPTTIRDWLDLGAGAVSAQHETVTALGKRGEAYPPRGKRGEAGLPHGKGVRLFRRKRREENPPSGWVCLFGGAGQVRQREADEAKAVRAAVSLPVLSPAKTERLNTAGRMSARRPRQNEFC